MSSQSQNPIIDPAQKAELLLEIVRALMMELHPDHNLASINIDSSLDRELGFDSLSRVELLARVEKAFQVVIPEHILTIAETPRDFLREIRQAPPATTTTLPSQVQADKSSHVAIPEEPFSAQTLVEVIEWHVKNHPDRPHIRFYQDDDREDQLTYQELLAGAKKIAGGLQQLGLNPRESVVIMLPTGKDYFFSFLGVLLAGGVPVPVYPPGHIKQIEEHLRRHVAITNNCQAGIMITMPETLRFAKLMKSQVVGLNHLVTTAQLEEKSTTSIIKPILHENDLAFLQYTSGSTGDPKGVMLTHANLLANIRSMGQVVKVTSKDVFVSWLPLYHDMGLIGAWLGSLYFGCQLVLMSPLAFIARPIRWLRAIHQYRGTLSSAPNFAYELCLRRLDEKDLTGLDLSSWRMAFNGAEAISPETLSRFTEKFIPHGFRPKAMAPVYGLAESSVGLAFPPLERGYIIDRVCRTRFMETGEANQATKDESNVQQFINCGHPLPGHQIRIVDNANRELPDRREGRIQFQGPSATSGYFRNPAKTKDLFCGSWLETGDKGYIADGDVYITGRSKDIIIRAGRNVYPEEMEEAIGKIQGVRAGNVAVFGTASEAGTEQLVILAESRKRDASGKDELRNQINAVVTIMVGMPPDHVVIALPNTVLKTSSGKIRRGACRALYEGGYIGKPSKAVWFQVARFTLKGVFPWIRQIRSFITSSLYAAWCWLLCALAIVLLPPVALIPKESWRWAITRCVLKILFRIGGINIKVKGNDNLPKDVTPYIYVSNHASYLDGFAVASSIPSMFSFVAKGELRKNSIIRLLLGRIGTLFVERFDKKQTFEDAKQLIEKTQSGRSLFFFAEGTFMRMPGLLPFRMGPFETAAKTRVPIVPITIRGTRSILRAKSWFPRRGTVSITIGKPIGDISPKEKMNEWDLAIALRDQTRAWILKHCGEPDLEHERPATLMSISPRGEK